jgi:hypothetical protein
MGMILLAAQELEGMKEEEIIDAIDQRIDTQEDTWLMVTK